MCQCCPKKYGIVVWTGDEGNRGLREFPSFEQAKHFMETKSDDCACNVIYELTGKSWAYRVVHTPVWEESK